MIGRCHNQNGDKYRFYGGRGISVCPEWRADFTQFVAHIGLRPSPSHSVDRIDVDGNYQPGNVRWATQKQQAANRRSALRFYDVDDNRISAADIAHRLAMNGTSFLNILRRSMDGRFGKKYLGEESSRAKLTSLQVLDIVRRVMAGEKRYAVAKSHGVSESNVDSIVTGKTWQTVTGIQRKPSVEPIEGRG
jgi:hypothetical protein